MRTLVRDASRDNRAMDGMNVTQQEFLQAANVAAVESVVGAIEAQVEKLLPEGVSKASRNRVVGEIFRELDTGAEWESSADAAGAGCVSIGEAGHGEAERDRRTDHGESAAGDPWRCEARIERVDEHGGDDESGAENAAEECGAACGRCGFGRGNGGRRATTAKDIDYRRMSDADILNL